MPPVLKLTAFQGEMPKIEPRLLPATVAQSAIDVRLDDGVLTPVRKRKEVNSGTLLNAKTIYKHDGSWYEWADVVHAAQGPVATDRLYYTGDGKPKMRVGATIYDLAVPKPTAALTAVAGAATSGAKTARVYVYTYVTDLGEESEPSAASNEVVVQPGQTVTLTGFAAAPSGRTNITRQRIYRTQTGRLGTTLYLIEDRAVGAGSFVDNVAVTDFAEPIPSVSYNTPPDALKGLTPMPNGMMAAFDGKKVYFCEPYQPHAWPEKYVLTTTDEIVGLGAIGTTLIVMTEGITQIASGSMPSSMSMSKLEANYPCINERSIVDLGYVIAYASTTGVVAIDAAGRHQFLTANLFNRDEYLDLEPSTWICSQHMGEYVAFYDTTNSSESVLSGMLKIPASGDPTLSRSAIQAIAAFYDRADGSLNYLPANDEHIYRYDDPSQPHRDMYWKSKEYVFSYPENFGAILIDGTSATSQAEIDKLIADRDAIISRNEAKVAGGLDIGGDTNLNSINELEINGSTLEAVPVDPLSSTTSVAIRIYADKELVFTVNDLNQTVRLPSGFEARTWEIDVTASVQIDHIILGRTVNDIASVV